MNTMRHAIAMAAFASEAWQLRHPDGSPYLTRHVLWGANALDAHDFDAPSSAFVHEIHTADGDRHMHNHPWVWAVALVLSGGYVERRPNGRLGELPGELETRFVAGDLNILRPDDYHSIVAVEPGTRTLFLCGREAHDWGFLVDGVHVPHAAYFARSDVQRMTHARVA